MTAPEFSRRVAVEDITDAGIRRDLDPTAEERAALAERLGLLALHSLTGEVRLRPLAGGVLLDGSLQADVEQACVITLEPIKSNVASRFSVRYISPQVEAAGMDGEELDPLGEDVEPLPADAIDIGEVAAQYLSLAVDPYPKKAGAGTSYAAGRDHTDAAAELPERPNPFVVLTKLQHKG